MRFGQIVKGIPGSRRSIVAIDRALKRHGTSRARRVKRHWWRDESHPEGPSARKEEDKKAGGHVHLYFALAGNQRPRSGTVKSAKDSETTLSFFITVAGKLITSRSLSRPTETRMNRKRALEVAFFEIIRENR